MPYLKINQDDAIVGDAIIARVVGDNLAPLNSCDVDRLRRYFA